jgi:putative phage-type endonuclease
VWEATVITRHEITSREQWLELRRHDVTASEVGALLGVHPYKTIAALYADKLGMIKHDDTGPDAIRGVKLEPFVADQVRENNPTWDIQKSKYYFRDEEHHLGATPDYMVNAPEYSGLGPLEIKTVEQSKFDRLWKAEGDVVPEPWIILQVMLQIYLTQSDFGMVAVMPISGWAPLEVYVILIPRNDELIHKIIHASEDFWDRVRSHEPPPFDFERDEQTIKSLYPSARKGTKVDLSGDNEIKELLDNREYLKKELKQRRDYLDAIEANIRAKIGVCETAIVDGWNVELKNATRKSYTVAETTYRELRATRNKF